jgi:hypothetical protein
MAAYKPYANEKPQTKFEKFVLAGIAYDDAEHSHKVLIGAPVDHLEDCAHQVAREIQESVRVSVEESLAAAERAAELHFNNETSEFVMGLRLSAPVEPGQEEGLDICAIDLTDKTNPAFALGPRPSFRSFAYLAKRIRSRETVIAAVAVARAILLLAPPLPPVTSIYVTATGEIAGIAERAMQALTAIKP